MKYIVHGGIPNFRFYVPTRIRHSRTFRGVAPGLFCFDANGDFETPEREIAEAAEKAANSMRRGAVWVTNVFNLGGSDSHLSNERHCDGSLGRKP